MRRYPADDFRQLFDPALLSALHYRLFKDADEASGTLADGRLMQPGRLRSAADEQVAGQHDAPDAAAVLAMLRHLQDGFGRIVDPRRQLIAVLALILQGAMPRNELKVFTGLTPRPAIDELQRLIQAGVVLSPTPKSRLVLPGLPAWFAQEIFPDLHRRFQ